MSNLQCCVWLEYSERPAAGHDFRPRVCRDGEGKGYEFPQPLSVIAVRILLGLIMIASGIKRAAMVIQQRCTRQMVHRLPSILGLRAFFQMVKVTEIVRGSMLLFSIFPALATLFLPPDVCWNSCRQLPLDAFIPMGLV